MPEGRVDNREDKVYEDAGQTTVEGIADAWGKQTGDCKVHHVSESTTVRKVMLLYRYTPADDTVESPEHNSEPFDTSYWRQMKKAGAVRQRNR